MNLRLPELSLVVLIGASGSGKSTLARRLFKPTEILSSDTCRGWVSDDENSQEATGDAFDVLHYVARKRLARALLTVIDATNVRSEDRRPLVQLAREYHVLPVAIVVDTPEHVCHARNQGRPDRQFGPHVVRNQRLALRREAHGLQREGFRHVFWLSEPEHIDAATVTREPLWNNRRHEHGPFDIIGDVHGCFDELIELMIMLGWRDDGEGSWTHEASRKLVFVGDLVDRGPRTPDVLRLVMKLVERGRAMCVPGNHDAKLLRALRGKNVQLSHGLAESMDQLGRETAEFRERVAAFIDDLVSHYVLDDGKLVVAHAGLKESMHGRGSGAVREFALYGETTGETDEFGLPVRYNWAADYRGRAAVVYGHTPVPRAEWLNGTICIDTGCAFGGRLTALRWPERTLESVSARATYAEPRRPFLSVDPAALSMQQRLDATLDIDDVLGKRIIETRLMRNITVRSENAAAALEVMSRFAADPRWLVYLPPTMSPCETSSEPGLLEHPREAFSYYRSAGIAQVVCEEKHMGSRAVVVVCKTAAAARSRFGVEGDRDGVILTRTGRPFFEDQAIEQALVAYVRDAAFACGLWADLDSDWMLLDCELMPWSAKAQSLIRDQYAAVASAADLALGEAERAASAAAARLPEAQSLLDNVRVRRAAAEQYAHAYRRYCWPVQSPADLRLAPFHLLASEGRVHTDRDHTWHMNTLARLAEPGAPVLVATPWRIVDLSVPESETAATDWWLDLTSRGGEGMVVKPMSFVADDSGGRGVVQPAIKVRGPEYLRIIYGPEYLLPANLDRLRRRALGAKRGLALREFALGIEALERFVRREPLRRIHECVFAVLAMESEPVDPRL